MSRIVICSECNGEFKTSTNQLTCSLKCGRSRKSRLRREQSREKVIDKKFKSYCTECGNRIVSYTSVYTCSNECKRVRKARLQKERRCIKANVKTLVCTECHFLFRKGNRKNVCSDKCAKKRKVRLQRESYISLDIPDPIPDLSKLPDDIPDDSRWMAEKDITIAREWVKHPTGNWRRILEEMATAVRRKVKAQNERFNRHKKTYRRGYQSF